MADTDTEAPEAAPEKEYVQAKFLRPYGFRGRLVHVGQTLFVTKPHALELRRRGIVEPVAKKDE